MTKQAKTLYEIFKQEDRYISRSEITDFFGCSDSYARNIVREVAKHYPIISTSHTTGYKLAKTPGELEDVVAAWKEIDSRIKELTARKEPLIKFYNKTRYKQ